MLSPNNCVKVNRAIPVLHKTICYQASSLKKLLLSVQQSVEMLRSIYNVSVEL